jgi:hypothetical protein
MRMFLNLLKHSLVETKKYNERVGFIKLTCTGLQDWD